MGPKILSFKCVHPDRVICHSALKQLFRFSVFIPTVDSIMMANNDIIIPRNFKLLEEVADFKDLLDLSFVFYAKILIHLLL